MLLGFSELLGLLGQAIDRIQTILLGSLGLLGQAIHWIQIIRDIRGQARYLVLYYLASVSWFILGFLINSHGILEVRLGRLFWGL